MARKSGMNIQKSKLLLVLFAAVCLFHLTASAKGMSISCGQTIAASISSGQTLAYTYSASKVAAYAQQQTYSLRDRHRFFVLVIAGNAPVLP